jgi:hypothetical protein
MFLFSLFFQEVPFLGRVRKENFDSDLRDFYVYKNEAMKCGAVKFNNQNEVKWNYTNALPFPNSSLLFIGCNCTTNDV